jgi:transcriptional regulator with XRE-family HTH domain
MTKAAENDFHRCVLALLKARDMKMSEFARALRFEHCSNVSGILRHGHPTLKTVEKFAEILGVKPSVLLNGDEAEIVAARSELAAARTELAAVRLEAATARIQ